MIKYRHAEIEIDDNTNRKPYPPSYPRRAYRTCIPARLWVPTNLPADQAGISGWHTA